MNNVTIAFMTNYTLDIPNISKQYNTIKSFYDVFKIDGFINTFIFCDEKPLSEINGEIQLFNDKIYDDYRIPGLEFEKNLKNIEYFKNAILIKTN